MLLAEDRRDRRPAADAPLLQEADLLRVVVEDGGPGDVGGVGDLVHGRRLEPLGDEQPDRRFVQLIAYLAALPLPAPGGRCLARGDGSCVRDLHGLQYSTAPHAS